MNTVDIPKTKTVHIADDHTRLIARALRYALPKARAGSAAAVAAVGAAMRVIESSSEGKPPNKDDWELLHSWGRG